MGTGLLYSKLQPHTITNQWLQIMESDRKSRLAAHSANAKKMQDYRINLFKDEEKVDAKGEFLNAATRTMFDARRDKVDLWNQMRAGKISEEDFLLAKERIDDIPLIINSAYQSYEGKLKEVIAGDEKGNYDVINGLLKSANTLSLNYDSRTRDVNVSFKDVDGNTQKMTVKEYNGLVNNIVSIPNQGDPVAITAKFGNDFKVDDISINGRREKGKDVGNSMDNFNSTYITAFGDRDAGDNMLVKKYMVSDNTDLDSYGEAWDALYYNALKRIPNLISVKAPPKAKQTSEEKLIKSFESTNPTIISGVTEITPIGGKKENVIAAKFTTPNTKKAVELEFGDVEGNEGFKGTTEVMTVSSYAINEIGDVFVKGNIKGKGVQGAALAGEIKGAEDLIKADRKTQIGWVKLTPSGKAQVESSLFTGLDPTKVYQILFKKRGSIKTQQTQNTISESEIKDAAINAGYSISEYRKKLESNGIEITK